MASRQKLFLIAAALLLGALMPALAQAADKPVASAPIPPPAMPPAPYVARPHRAPQPPPIPKASALERKTPVADKDRRSEPERLSREAWTRRHRHPRPDRHRAVARVEKPPVPAPAAVPTRRRYAGDMPPVEWEAPPPGWYEYYPMPPWRRDPMPW